jgi:hypothetical protein
MSELETTIEELLQRVKALEGPPKWKPPAISKEELRQQFVDDGYNWSWKGEAIGGRDPALVVWEVFEEEPVPYGFVLRRRCDHERCVKPEHMILTRRRDLECRVLERMVWEGEHIRRQREEWNEWAKQNDAKRRRA